MKNNKSDFPIFENNKGLVYLDSASTSQMPKVVIDRVTKFSEAENSNVGRGIYDLSVKAGEEFESVRRKVSDFIGGKNGEVIFTSGTTMSLNLLSYALQGIIGDGKDEIVISEMEHHSNIVCWQELCRRSGMKLKFIPVLDNFELDYVGAKRLICEKTAIVSLCHVSNVLGTVNNLEKVSSLTKKANAIFVVDAAQSVGHMDVDVEKVGCDFLVFSAHKIFGPMGVGVLWGKNEILKKMNPLLFGGGMISFVSKEESSWAKIPEKFEAGTQNVSGIIGLGSAIDYLNGFGTKTVEECLKRLFTYAFGRLKEINGIKIYSGKNGFGIISFNLDGIHSHDVASIVNDYGIAIRAGHHCAMPLMKRLGVDGTCRISFQIYNSEDDVDRLIEGLKKVLEVFRE